MNTERHIGLFSATSLGVGAIVGGGILALAGIGFATAGPAAIVAFALNGVIALLTVSSFAALARRFPESGGIYAYAKKVLAIEVAFAVGWVVWFASVLAGVLYALGFAAFAAQGMERLLANVGGESNWIGGPLARTALAVGAVGAYAILLARRAGGGGNAVTVGKVVFLVSLVVAGFVAWVLGDGAAIADRLNPFAWAGSLGVLQAMGYTFVALQGFDLIAAVAGEVRDPQRVVPKAMYASLAISLAIYLPLLLVIATVGAPDEGVQAAATQNPEGMVADAAERYLGGIGYWLVIGAGLLSMLAALHANVFGASRVAFAMARDRTLPRPVGRVARVGTPSVAVAITGGLMAITVLVVGNVASAGAASSLIFLLSFTIVHWAAWLTRRRSVDDDGRGMPLVPVTGAIACLGLAAFQAFAVPEAGSVVVVWMALGVVLYLVLLAPGARIADASAQASDPDLVRLRGRSPLVLAPVANPANAAGVVEVAATVRAPGVGRILLLSVIEQWPDRDRTEPVLESAVGVLSESLRRGIESAAAPETLFTMAPNVWEEIARVAEEHQCETVILGLPRLGEGDVGTRLTGLLSTIAADAVIVRAPHRWRVSGARRVLVPISSRMRHGRLRARLLASLARARGSEVTFFTVIPAQVSADERARIERKVRARVGQDAIGPHELEVVQCEDPATALVDRARDADLVVMGLERGQGAEAAIAPLPLAVVHRTETPVILISQRPGPSPLGSLLSG